MKKLLLLLVMTACPAFAQYVRYDYYLTNAQGQAISGAQVFILTQPANVNALTPQAPLYSDPMGANGPLAQPLVTDGFGHAFAYLLPSQQCQYPNAVGYLCYTVVSISPTTGTIVLPDQNIGGGGGGGGGGSSNNPVVSFTNATVVSMPSSTYGFNTPGIITTCYDMSGVQIQGNAPQVVNPAIGVYNLVFGFASPQSGTCVANASSSGSGQGVYLPLTGGNISGGVASNSSFTAQTIGKAAYADAFSGGDIGAKVNAAIASFTNGCGEVVIPNGTYTWTTSIQKPRCTRLHGQSALGTILNWTPTSGVGIIVADNFGTAVPNLPAGNAYPEGEISDLTVLGPAPNGAGTTSIGIYIGGDPAGIIAPVGYQGDHQNINRVRMFNWNQALRWGNNAFMTTVLESLISNNQSGYYYPSGLFNSGESITTLRSSVQNNVTGLNIPGYGDFYFYGSSCDYNVTCGIVSGAQFFGEHFEQNSGVFLTIQGQATATVNIFGGWAVEQCPTGASTCAGGTEPYMFHVTAAPPSQPNPHFLIDGLYMQSNHLITNVIGWEATGASSSVVVRDLPLYNSNANLPSMLSVPCTFIGCRLDTSQGNYAWTSLASKLDDNGNLVLNTVSTANGPVLSDILGFAAITGNYDTVSGTGGLAVYAMPGAPVSYFTPTTFNNFGKRIVTNDMAIGSSATVPVTFTAGAGAPSGACNTGSDYRNTSGGTNTTRYLCEAGAWVAK